MVAPIDYTTQVTTPIQSAVQGLQLGSGIADIRTRQAQREADADAQQQRRNALIALNEKENPTVEDYMAVANILPKDQADSIRASYEAIDTDRQQNSLASGGRILAAMQSSPELGIELLNKEAEVSRNSGDEEQAKAYETWAKIAEISPKQARNTIGIMLSSIPGGDKVIENLSKVSETRRKEGLHPSAIKQAAADIGKTEAETKKILKEVDKLGAEAEKAVIELEKMKSGEAIIDPKERFSQEEKLRKEYVGRTKGFIESQRVYENIKSSATAGAPGDIALVTSFMKMLDPGSVVRETEFATARDTAGLLTRLQNIASKVESGEFLSPSQRKAFVALAGKYMSATEKQEGKVREDLGMVVKNYSLNPDNVFGTRAESDTEPQQDDVEDATVTPKAVDNILQELGIM